MSDDENKPTTTKSFVSEKEIQEQANGKNPVQKIIQAEISLAAHTELLKALIEETRTIIIEMKTLNSHFKYTREQLEREQKPTESKPVETMQQKVEVPNKVLDVQNALGELANLLIIDYETSTLSIIVRPKQFLGAENFGKIASVIRGIGGQYVSAGKNSHFEIPKAEPRKQF